MAKAMVVTGLSKAQIVDEMTLPEIELVLKTASDNDERQMRLLSLAIHDPSKLVEYYGQKETAQAEKPGNRFSSGLQRLVQLQHGVDEGHKAELIRKIQLREKAAKLIEAANG